MEDALTDRMHCPLCETPFRVLRYQDGMPQLVAHMETCETKSPEERVFYRKHRRWPKKLEHLQRPPPKTSAERMRAWRARHG